MTLSSTHRQYLNEHAVTDDVIERHGVRSEGDEIVFPWTDGDRHTEQRRPWPGGSGVYFWEPEKDLHFWMLRDAGPGTPVLLIEGTKQSLAGSAYAPEGFTVMGMAGCWGWSKERLGRFKDRDVYLCLDADAASNLDVYEAGDKLGEKARRYGVNLRYLRIPGSGSQGLDDYLASLEEDERAEILAYEIQHAHSKPAERRPTNRKRKMESDMPDLGDRVGVAINLDRKQVIDKITGALKERHDAVDLFNYGDVLTRVQGHETQPLDRDRFYAMLADAVACFRYTEATDKRPALFEPAWPDPPSIGAVMSKSEEFSTLTRVVRVPFLRPDGSVCTAPGYDRETTTVLVPSGLGELHVPEEPTKEQVRLAAKYLLSEWLGDLPFKTEADRANALAWALTPFMRGLVPLAPLTVVSGLQMGVGKNLLADCIHILATGEAAMPLPYVASEEEMRKQLTAAFAGGAEMFIFDEAHVVEGAQLARAVTSLTYGDRVLGVSRIAKFPNQVTWASLGNQVQVNGDMARRVYFVYLHPTSDNVIDREAKEFRHPDLKAWTKENRTDLVSAALTVLRGWVVAGRPAYSRGACMGSFEPWDRMLSGVLAYAGHPAFLTDMRERRSESDYTNSYWESHIHWLHSLFGDEEFTTRQVQEAALRDPAGYEAPPGMEDASGKAFTRQLGQGYAKHRDRNYNGVRLVKAGMGHKSTIKWRTVSQSGGMEVSGGNATTPPVTGERLSDVRDAHTRVGAQGGAVPSTSLLTSSAPLEPQGSLTYDDWGSVVGPAEYPDQEPTVLGFDLETASVDQLFTGGHEGPYVRLPGVITEATERTIPSVPALLVTLNRADVIHDHNGFGFDLLALARHCGADYAGLAAKNWDTQVAEYVIDPPLSKGMPSGYYSLNGLAERYGVPVKTDDIKRLAAKHGGFDRIPLDSREYQDYLRGDLATQHGVYKAQRARATELGLDEYLAREMRVAALQNTCTLNGWRVDTELLAERVKHEDDQRLAAIQVLHTEYGVPLARPDRYKVKPRAEWPEDYRNELSVALVREGLQEDPERSVEAGLAVRIPGEPYIKPWGSPAGRAAIVAAGKRAGAEHWPLSESGTPLTSADALGDKEWYDADRKDNVPGLLEVYGHLDGVRALVDTISLATGARAKYAEFDKWLTPEGRVHPLVGATQGSGRWAYVKPSTSTTGKRGPAKAERDVLVADDGHMMLTSDHSQLDVRTVAALSQDPELIGMLQPDSEDYHEAMAEVYFRDRSRRSDAKPINHGVNYGQGFLAIAKRNGLDPEMVRRALIARGDRFIKLMQWTEAVRAQAEAGMLLDNGFGRPMRPSPGRAYTQAPALMGQGASRDVMAESMLRLDRISEGRVRPFLRGVIHDEIVLSVPEADVVEWQEMLREAMTWEWRGVPILCDVSAPAYRWSECA